MAQFHAYRNQNPDSKKTTPYLLDVQSNLLNDLATRVVIPLRLARHYRGEPAKTLMPVFEIEGAPVLALTQQLAAVPNKALGESVADLSSQQHQIVAALDFLISGV